MLMDERRAAKIPREYLVDNRVYTDPKLFEVERDGSFSAYGTSFVM